MADVTKNLHGNSPLVKYIDDHSLRRHPVQVRLLERTLKHPDSMMVGSPTVLHLLSNLMKLINAKRVLDVGVYTGSSTLNAALAIPHDGEVFALDINEEYISIAKEFWKEAGVEHKIKLRIAPALQTLDELIAGGDGSFDFAFVDADKSNYCNYFERCLRLVRSGGIIAFDNVLWSGTVVDPDNKKRGVEDIRALNDLVYACDKVDVSMLNVGDGLTLAFVK